MTFKTEIEEIISNSRKVAIDLGDNHISSYHFLLALLRSENVPHTIFNQKEWDFQYLVKHFQKEKPASLPQNFYLTKEMERSLKIAGYYAWIYHQSEISAEHFIFAMLADKRSSAGSLLIQNGLTYSCFENEYEKMRKPEKRKWFKAIGENNFLVRIGLVKLIYQTIHGA